MRNYRRRRAVSAKGYVGAFLADGFGASGLVLQIAHEIAAAVPELFAGLRLTQAWAYKCDDDDEEG